MFHEYFKIFCCLFSKALKQMLLLDRETGALCAMKEVELFPDDPKSAECIKQLEQVGCPLLAFCHCLFGNCVEFCVSCFFVLLLQYISYLLIGLLQKSVCQIINFFGIVSLFPILNENWEHIFSHFEVSYYIWKLGTDSCVIKKIV